MSSGRIKALAEQLNEQGLDAYFACTPVSMGYLADFWEDAHERFMVLAINTQGQTKLICPRLSANQAKRVGISNISDWADGEDPLALLQELASEWGLKTGIVAVDGEMRAAQLLRLQETLPACLFKNGDTVLGSLRVVKDDQEIALLMKASQIADQAYIQVLSRLKLGMTELEIASLTKDCMKNLGGEPTFCIAAIGEGSAEPHHLNCDRRLAAGDMLLMDFGCSWQGYNSDITRCISVGKATEKMKHVYEIVRKAHQAGFEAAKAGVSGAEVDLATRSVIENAGFCDKFVHRTGHGIGLQVHEEPYISSANTQAIANGNCFSIEPGIYLAGEFGVRIENLAYIQGGECRSFNAEAPLQLPEIDCQ